MDIIAGIFTEEMFTNIGSDNALKVLKSFKPLLRSSTALEMYTYMSRSDADKSIVSLIDEVLGDDIATYVYINKIRADRLNTNVLNYDVLSVEDAYKEGMFCGMPLEDGINVISKVIKNRVSLKASDSNPSRSEWEAFKDCMLTVLRNDKPSYNKFLINSTRVYNTKAKTVSLGVGGIINRMESLEMGLKGVRYLQYLEEHGIAGVGGIMF